MPLSKGARRSSFGSAVGIIFALVMILATSPLAVAFMARRSISWLCARPTISVAAQVDLDDAQSAGCWEKVTSRRSSSSGYRRA